MLMLSTTLIFTSVKAVDISSANIVSKGECPRLLIYKDIELITNYACYTKNGIEYPAYCLNQEKQGVKSDLSYTVSVDSAIADVKLWRILINGYPYKTPKELGCETKEEAYTATKQAIYCYIIGRDRNSYKGIGEAGNRTANAIKVILANAEKSTETQISNNVKIIKDQKYFEVDNKEKEYASKTYSISAGTTISSYKIKISKINKDLAEGIKITDINNKEKSEFAPNEKFKILIPIKNMTEENNFNIEVQTQIKNKPILYGKAPNSSYQDYALTSATYEDAKGATEDRYYKNETKVIIIKQDQETKERLENVEFNVLDSNKDVIYANLKTDGQGEIKVTNIVPGTYYIQETTTKDGYEMSNNVIKIDSKLNEECTIKVNNLYKEIPEPQKASKEITNEVKNEKETYEPELKSLESSLEVNNEKSIIATPEIEKKENSYIVDNEKELSSQKVTKSEQEHIVSNVKKLPVTGM